MPFSHLTRDLPRHSISYFEARVTAKLAEDYGLTPTPATTAYIAELFGGGWDIPTAAFLAAQFQQGAKP